MKMKGNTLSSFAFLAMSALSFFPLITLHNNAFVYATNDRIQLPLPDLTTLKINTQLQHSPTPNEQSQSHSSTPLDPSSKSNSASTSKTSILDLDANIYDDILRHIGPFRDRIAFLRASKSFNEGGFVRSRLQSDTGSSVSSFTMPHSHSPGRDTHFLPPNTPQTPSTPSTPFSTTSFNTAATSRTKALDQVYRDIQSACVKTITFPIGSRYSEPFDHHTLTSPIFKSVFAAGKFSQLNLQGISTNHILEIQIKNRLDHECTIKILEHWSLFSYYTTLQLHGLFLDSMDEAIRKFQQRVSGEFRYNNPGNGDGNGASSSSSSAYQYSGKPGTGEEFIHSFSEALLSPDSNVHTIEIFIPIQPALTQRETELYGNLFESLAGMKKLRSLRLSEFSQFGGYMFGQNGAALRGSMSRESLTSTHRQPQAYFKGLANFLSKTTSLKDLRLRFDTCPSLPFGIDLVDAFANGIADVAEMSLEALYIAHTSGDGPNEVTLERVVNCRGLSEQIVKNLLEKEKWAMKTKGHGLKLDHLEVADRLSENLGILYSSTQEAVETLHKAFSNSSTSAIGPFWEAFCLQSLSAIHINYFHFNSLDVSFVSDCLNVNTRRKPLRSISLNPVTNLVSSSLPTPISSSTIAYHRGTSLIAAFIEKGLSTILTSISEANLLFPPNNRLKSLTITIPSLSLPTDGIPRALSQLLSTQQSSLNRLQLHFKDTIMDDANGSLRSKTHLFEDHIHTILNSLTNTTLTKFYISGYPLTPRFIEKLKQTLSSPTLQIESLHFGKVNKLGTMYRLLESSSSLTSRSSSTASLNTYHYTGSSHSLTDTQRRPLHLYLEMAETVSLIRGLKYWSWYERPESMEAFMKLLTILWCPVNDVDGRVGESKVSWMAFNDLKRSEMCLI